MPQQTERRRTERLEDGDLPPEYLALLEVCGGEIRSSDRALLAARRRNANAGEPPATASEVRDPKPRQANEG